MTQQVAEQQTPRWFGEQGTAGQEEASGAEEGAELPVEDEGEVLEEVEPSELQPPEAELKGKDDKPKKLTLTIPKSDGQRRSPKWAKLPQGMRFPKGIDVLFVLIKAEWTMYPGKGDRQCILWAMTDGDQKMAIGRSMGDRNRLGIEMTKQMIRSADGQTINWTGDPSATGIDVDRFWHEIGPKGRNLLDRVTTQLCVMNETEYADFFEHCIAAVRTG